MVLMELEVEMETEMKKENENEIEMKMETAPQSKDASCCHCCCHATYVQLFAYVCVPCDYAIKTYPQLPNSPPSNPHQMAGNRIMASALTESLLLGQKCEYLCVCVCV